MASILVIAPHADDEILGVGGTLHKHVNQHDDVNVVIVADRDNLKVKQRNQSKEIRDTIKYNKIFHLGLPDEHLGEHVHEIIHQLEEVYAKVKPDIVYTCNSEELNLDHLAVYAASTIVCRPHQKHPPKMVLLYEVLSSSFTPNYYSILSWFQVMRKQMVMKIYTDEVREDPHPRSSHGIDILAKKRGIECGSEYAEGFKLYYCAHENTLG